MNTNNVNKNVKNKDKDTIPREGRPGKILSVPPKVFSSHTMPELLARDQENDGGMENMPTVRPFAGFKLASSIEGASATAFRSHSLSTGRYKDNSADNIEGELWFVTPNTGPRNRNTPNPNWVTCNKRHLVVYSSWSEKSRIIDAVSFDAVRILFSFSHVHKHKNNEVQVPRTTVSRQGHVKESSISKRLPTPTSNPDASVSRRRASRGSIRNFHTRGGTTLPRYYFFGIEFRKSNEHDDETNARHRRVMVFSTDIKNDRGMWLQFFQEVLAVKEASLSRKGNARSLSSTWFAPHNSPPQNAIRVVCSESNDENEETPQTETSAPLNYGDKIYHIGGLMDSDDDIHSASSLSSISQGGCIAEYERISALQKKEKEESSCREACIAEENYHRILLRAVLDLLIPTNISAQNINSQIKTETDQDNLIQAKKTTSNDIYLKTKKCLEPLQEVLQTLRNNIKTKENELHSLKKANQRHHFNPPILEKNLTETIETKSEGLQSDNAQIFGEQDQDNISTLRNENRTLLQHLASASHKIEELQNKQSVSKESEERNRIEMEQLQSRVAVLDAENAMLSERVRALGAHLDAADDECGVLSRFLGIAPAWTDDSSDGTGAGAREDVPPLAERLKAACSAVEELEQRLHASEVGRCSAQEEVERNRIEMEQLQSRVAVLDAENAMLSERVRALGAHLDAADGECGVLSRFLGIAPAWTDDSSDGTGAGAREDVPPLAERLKAACSAVEELEQRLHASEVGRCSAQEEVERNRIEMEQLQSRVAVLDAENAMLSERVRALGAHLDAADDECGVLSRFLGIAPAWTDDSSDGTGAGAREDVPPLAERLKAACSAVEELEQRLHASEVGRCSAQEEVERNRIEMEQLQSRVAVLDAENAMLSERVRALGAHLDAADDECGVLSRFLGIAPAWTDDSSDGTGAGAREDVPPLAERLKAACSAVEELEQRLHASEVGRCSAQEEVERNRIEMEQLQSRVAVLDAENAMLSERVRALGAHLDAADDECGVLSRFLGIAPAWTDDSSDGTGAGAREDVPPLAERLKAACSAVEELEQRLHASEVGRCSAQEEVERNRIEMEQLQSRVAVLDAENAMLSERVRALGAHLDAADDECGVLSRFLGIAPAWTDDSSDGTGAGAREDVPPLAERLKAACSAVEELEQRLHASEVGRCSAQEEVERNRIEMEQLQSRVAVLDAENAMLSERVRALGAHLDAADGECGVLSRFLGIAPAWTDDSSDGTGAGAREDVPPLAERLKAACSAVEELEQRLHASEVDRCSAQEEVERNRIEMEQLQSRVAVLDAENAMLSERVRALGAHLDAADDECGVLSRFLGIAPAWTDDSSDGTGAGAREDVPPLAERLKAACSAVEELEQRLHASEVGRCSAQEEVERNRIEMEQLQSRVAVLDAENAMLSERVRALGAHLDAADGECGVLSRFLGIASAWTDDSSDGTGAGAREDVPPLAERLKAACSAVEELEQRLHASEVGRCSAQEEVERNRIEMEQLQSRVAVLDAENAMLSERVRALGAHLDAADGECGVLSRFLGIASAWTDDSSDGTGAGAREDVPPLAERLKAACSAVEELEQRLHASEVGRCSAQEEVERNRIEMEQLQSRVAVLDAENAMLSERVRALGAHLDAADDECGVLSRFLGIAPAWTDDSSDGTGAGAREDVPPLAERLKAACSAVEELEQRLHASEVDRCSAQEEVERNRIEMEQLQSRVAVLDAENAMLSERVRALGAHLDAADDECGVLSRFLGIAPAWTDDSSDGTGAGAREDVPPLAERLKAACSAVEELEQRLHASEVGRCSAQEEVERNRIEMEQLQSRVAVLDAENAMLSERVRALGAHLDAADGECGVLSRFLGIASAWTDDSSDGTGAGAERTAVEELEQRLHASEVGRCSAQEEVERNRIEMEQLQSRVAVLDAENAMLSERVRALGAHLDAADDECGVLSRFLGIASAWTDDSSDGTGAGAREDVPPLAERLKAACSAVEELEQRLHASEVGRCSAQEEVERNRIEMEQLQSRVAVLDAENAMLSERVRALGAHLDAADDECGVLSRFLGIAPAWTGDSSDGTGAGAREDVPPLAERLKAACSAVEELEQRLHASEVDRCSAQEEVERNRIEMEQLQSRVAVLDAENAMLSERVRALGAHLDAADDECGVLSRFLGIASAWTDDSSDGIGAGAREDVPPLAERLKAACSAVEELEQRLHASEVGRCSAQEEVERNRIEMEQLQSRVAVLDAENAMLSERVRALGAHLDAADDECGVLSRFLGIASAWTDDSSDGTGAGAREDVPPLAERLKAACSAVEELEQRLHASEVGRCSAQEEVERNRIEMEQLQSRVAVLDAENAMLSERVRALGAHLDAADGECGVLSRFLGIAPAWTGDSSDGTGAGAREDVPPLAERLKAACSAVEELEQRLHASEVGRCSAQEEVERNRIEMEQLQSRVAVLDAENAMLSERVRALGAHLDAADDECGVLSRFLGIASAWTDDSSDGIGAGAREDVPPLAERLKAACSAVEELEQRLHASEVGRCSAQEEVERNRIEMEQLQSRVAVLDAENAMLSERVRALGAHLDAADGECGVLSRFLGIAPAWTDDSSDGTGAGAREDVPPLAERLKAACSAVEELEQRLHASEVGRCSAQEEVERNRIEMEQLQSRVAVLDAENAMLSERVRALGAHLDAADGECGVLSRFLGIAPAWTDDSSDGTGAGAREDVPPLAERLKAACSAVEELEQRLHASEVGRCSAQEEVERNRIEMEQLQSRVAVLDAENAMLSERVRALGAHLDAADDECGVLSRFLGIASAWTDDSSDGIGAGAREDVPPLAERLKAACSAVEELEQRLHASEVGRCSAQEEVERNRIEMEQLQSRVAVLDAENAMLSERVRALGAHLDAADGECGVLSRFLGIAPAWTDDSSDGTGAGAREDVPPLAERLKAACSAVEELEQRLHASEVGRCSAQEEVERNRIEMEQLQSLLYLSVGRCMFIVDVSAALQGRYDFLLRVVGGAVYDLRDLLMGLSRKAGESRVETCVDDAYLDVMKVDRNNNFVVVEKFRDMLRVLEEVWYGMHYECERFEDQCSCFHDIMVSLELGDVFSSSLSALLNERSEVLQGLVAKDENVGVKGGFSSLDELLERYSLLQTMVVTAVNEDTKHAVRLVEDQIGILQRSLDVTRRSRDEITLALKGVAAPKSSVSGKAMEDEYGSVVDDVRQTQKCVVSTLHSLVVSVGGDGDSVIRESDGASLEKTLEALLEECRKASEAFTSLKSVLENSGDVCQPPRGSSTSSVGGSINNSNCSECNFNRISLPLPLPPIHGYDDVVSCVVRCLSCVWDGRERNERLMEELRRVLYTTSAPTSPFTPQTSEELASQKHHLLLPFHEVLDEVRGPPPIVGEVRQHLAARAAEVGVLRSAVVKSVETLGGSVTPATAESQLIANALVELACETGDSIAEVRAILDPATVHRGPMRLRDLVGRLEGKVQECEAGTRQARELVESIMHINDPSFSLIAKPGRSLTSKTKPPPVASSNSNESLSLNRSIYLSAARRSRGSSSSSSSSICNDSSLANAFRQLNQCMAATGQEAPVITSGKDVNIDSMMSSPGNMKEAFQNIRAKLISIRQLTNACGAAVCMMGDEFNGEGFPLEALPLRILQKAQEVHEVLQLTHETCYTLEDGENETAKSVPSSLLSRIIKITDALKRLQNENAALHQQGIAVEKQKSFLLQDFDHMRKTLERENEHMKKECDDLVNERDELKAAIERAKEEEQARDTALKQAREELSSLQVQCNQLRDKRDQQQMESNSLRAMRDDLRLSMVGLGEAALTIRRATASVSERTRSIVLKLAKDSSIAKESSRDVSDPHKKVTEREEENKGNEKGNNDDRKEEKGREMSLTRTGEKVNVASVSAAHLLAESSSELRRCSWDLIRIEHNVQGVTQLREWLQKVSAWTKETIARDEAWMRLILRDVYRNGANLLAEKSRLEGECDNTIQSLQRRLDGMRRENEEELESEKQNLRNMEAAYNDHNTALQQQIDSLQQQKQQQDTARYEAERQAASWRSRSEAAVKEVSQLRGTIDTLQEELEQVRGRLKSPKRKTVESAVMTEPFEGMVDCLPAVFALMAAVGVQTNSGDRYADGKNKSNIKVSGVIGGAAQLKELLPLAVERAIQLSEDTAQCRAVFLKQLALLGSDDDDAGSVHQHQHERLKLIELIERHSKCFERFLAQRTELIGQWQGALDDLSRLQREFNENEEVHCCEVYEMELRISDLRGVVQRKLEADKIAEENMKEIEQIMDQLLSDLSKYTSEEAEVRRHVHELRRLIRSQGGEKRNAFTRL
ncbi:hypothetical protein LSM04_000384 [Trypanosoma melophagium]|uniref:uncharacterized protein n=1 Tax=Trypanosoma melophagium TaxID=715481 RepID=UPI00351A8AB5|nr:hypothetical protein LSM04_000384 [Trypanosoma melophagium]